MDRTNYFYDGENNGNDNGILDDNGDDNVDDDREDDEDNHIHNVIDNGSNYDEENYVADGDVATTMMKIMRILFIMMIRKNE